ncbi:MAG: DNA cytosine methyltransferase [Myroides sp.]
MPNAVDFFCSGGGMSYGMQKAGVNILAGIDFDITCKDTYEANIGENKFIHADVSKLQVEDLQQQLNLQQNDDNLLLIGCSPCQFWSIIPTKKEKSEQSKDLLIEFRRFVEYFNPGYVVVENVPGVERRKAESGLEDFIIWLENHDYTVHAAIHEVSEYGVPQHRKRFTLIANRVNNTQIEPLEYLGKKIKVEDVIGEKNGFPKISHGHKDTSDFLHTTAGLRQLNLDRLAVTPHNGGTRMEYVFDEKLAVPCHYGKTDGFKDIYGRMWWDRPAPTITTKFFNISNGRFAHPEEDRAISLREGAVLQSFPKTYKFKGTSIASIARMIGNAVPPTYAKAIGLAIINNHNNAI